MRNLFKFAIVAFIFFSCVNTFAQTTSKKYKIIHCKTTTVTLHLGVLELETSSTVCLVTVNGIPGPLWFKQTYPNNSDIDNVLFVNIKDFMNQNNIKDERDLENVKIVKNSVVDFDGTKYIIEASEEPLKITEDDEGIKYLIFPCKIVK